MSSLVRITALTLLCATCLTAPSHAEPKPATTVPPAADVDATLHHWLDLAVKNSDDREPAEVTISFLPADALPNLQAAVTAARAGADPAANQWLTAMLRRQKPYFESRLRRIAAAEERYKWNFTAVAAYDKFGHTNPRWDDAARAGIRGAVGTTAAQRSEARSLADAVKAGCDDPLVCYFYARNRITAGESFDAVEAIYEKAATDIAATGYPASRKVFTIMRYYTAKRAAETVKFRAAGANRFPDDVWQKLGQLQKDCVVEHYPRAVQEPDLPPSFILDMTRLLIDSFDEVAMDRQKIYDQLYPPFAKAAPNAPDPLIFKGHFYVKYAWDARGSGWANTVTPEGWEKMRQRLATASEALTKAYEMNPLRDDASAEMLTVELGQGNGLDAMKTWFMRTIQANPDNREACDTVLYYLQPKWYGSPADMIEFGRVCFGTHNWAGDIPFKLVEAHTQVSQLTQDPAAYFAQPDVWKDIQSVYEPFLAAHPNPFARSRYAYFACLTNHWDVAEKHFQLLGDQAVYRQFDGEPQYRQMRRASQEHASAPK